MNNQITFDSEYCHVEYIENDHAVLLSWKKFARIDDYRKPALFALDLLRQFPQSSFIVDARNGYEDDKEDVEWGFSELLPNMAKTTCRYVIFIMQKTTDIEDEMDMWTMEFQKYFAVSKVETYEQAIRKINTRLLVNVNYTIKPGKREEFLEKVKAQQIIRDSKAEPGNFKYEYYIPVDSQNTLFLMEIWACSEAQSLHGNTEHYKKLQALKKEYVTDVAIEKYEMNAPL
jgi:quinol monooxygenase YgiN